jgi:hypothetical protein
LREWAVETVFGYPGDRINGLPAAWGRADNRPQFADNRVTLADETDPYGQPIPRLDYALGDNDKANMAYFTKVITDILRSGGSPDVLTIQRFTHLIGGTRMDSCPREQRGGRQPAGLGDAQPVRRRRLGVPHARRRQSGSGDHGAGRRPRGRSGPHPPHHREQAVTAASRNATVTPPSGRQYSIHIGRQRANMGDTACPYGCGQHPYLSPGAGLIDRRTRIISARRPGMWCSTPSTTRRSPKTRAGTACSTARFPLFLVRRPQTILALEMNGEPLPVGHGAPVRLRVESQLGFKMAKWIRSIELVSDYRHLGQGQGGWREDQQYYTTWAASECDS